MKKLSIAFIVALVLAGISFADSNTVASANVLGYNKCTLKPGFNIIRMPFVDGTNYVDIQNVMITSNLIRGANIGAADSIQFWDAINLQYVRYFLHDGTGKNNSTKAGKWVDNATGLIASNVVPPASGFFFSSLSTSNRDVIVSGEVVVSQTGTNSLLLVEGFNLVANPFTCDWPLNDGSINWTNQGAKAGGTIGSADSIQTWDNASLQYDRYFLHDGTGKNNATKAGKWVDNTTGLVASNLTVETTQGFFYSRLIGQSSITIKIAQPYNLQ
jgi:hypothetical protein